MADLQIIEGDWLTRINAAGDLQALESERVAALGKQGAITGLLKTLGKMSADERQAEGPRIHGLREAVAAAIAERKAALEAAELDRKLATETLDMTLPVSPGPQGGVHPVSQVMDELAEIFADLGFSVATGPEIEDDWHNFSALNIPEDHPARAMHDTFYFDQTNGDGRRMLLRTHTSPVQIRAHDERETADPDHRAGPHLPLGQRCDPHPDVPPGRGPGYRSRHPSRSSEMDAGDVPQGLFRARRHRIAAAAELLPVH
jgi:phenylalanyl-tRNA synthetase alpha chain